MKPFELIFNLIESDAWILPDAVDAQENILSRDLHNFLINIYKPDYYKQSKQA